jgi:hypothetical protein
LPGLVDPASAEAAKERFVLVEYRYPNARSSIKLGAVIFKTVCIPPGAQVPFQCYVLGKALYYFLIKELLGNPFFQVLQQP